jgi:hypothetical protein
MLSAVAHGAHVLSLTASSPSLSLAFLFFLGPKSSFILPLLSLPLICKEVRVETCLIGCLHHDQPCADSSDGPARLL